MDINDICHKSIDYITSFMTGHCVHCVNKIQMLRQIFQIYIGHDQSEISKSCA
jgi:hypothetical protein